MGDKNFMSYGDAETVFSEYANAIKSLDPEGGTLDTRLSAVEEVIPSGASVSNQLATLSDVDGLLNALTTTKFTSDLNTCIEAGIHVFNQSTANRPAYVDWGCILVFGVNTKGDNNKYIYQLLFPTTGATKFRYSINSTTQIPTNWTSWQDIIKTSDLTSTVTSGSTAPVTSDGVYKSKYKIQTQSWNAAGNRYMKLSNMFTSSAGLMTTTYLVSSRNGEAYLMMCGNSDGGTKSTPQVIK